MTSSNPSHGALLGSAACAMSRHNEDSKAALPSDLLNLNDAEMATLFDPNCDHSKYHENLQEVVSSSVASLPLNESLDSLIRDLDELSQPVFAPVMDTVAGSMGRNTPVDFPDSTAEFLCNEDSFNPSIQNLPSLEFAYQSETSEALALLSMPSDVIEVHEDIKQVMDTSEEYQSIASTPDDPGFLLGKKSAPLQKFKENFKGDAFSSVHTSNFSNALRGNLVVSTISGLKQEAPTPSLDFEALPPTSEIAEFASTAVEAATVEFENSSKSPAKSPSIKMECASPSNVGDEGGINASTEISICPPSKLSVSSLLSEIPGGESVKPEVDREDITVSVKEVMGTILNEVETVSTVTGVYVSGCAPKSEVKGHILVLPDSGDVKCDIPVLQEVIAETPKSLIFSLGAQKIYACGSCDLKFVKITNLYRHFSAHTHKPAVCCEACDLIFNSGEEFQSHNVDVHHFSDEYLCTLCQLKVATYPEFVEHMGKHSKKEPFQCSECCLLFWDHSNFCKHSQEHTQELLFKCLVCTYVFRQELDLHSHEKFVHAAEVQEEARSDGLFMCESCGEFFTELKFLTNHANDVHRPSLKCETCGKCFSKDRGLKIHITLAHRKKSKFKKTLKFKSTFDCGICRKKFHNMAVYSRHMSSHKTQTRQSSLNAKFKIKVSSLSFSEKEFVCEVCCAAFPLKAELKRHILATHYCVIK